MQKKLKVLQMQNNQIIKIVLQAQIQLFETFCPWFRYYFETFCPWFSLEYHIRNFVCCECITIWCLWLWVLLLIVKMMIWSLKRIVVMKFLINIPFIFYWIYLIWPFSNPSANAYMFPIISLRMIMSTCVYRAWRFKL